MNRVEQIVNQAINRLREMSDEERLSLHKTVTERISAGAKMSPYDEDDFYIVGGVRDIFPEWFEDSSPEEVSWGVLARQQQFEKEIDK